MFVWDISHAILISILIFSYKKKGLILNILVLGSGAREHAICWAIKKSPKCKNIFCIPGNSGISKVAKCFDFNPQEKNTIYKFCKKKKLIL